MGKQEKFVCAIVIGAGLLSLAVAQKATPRKREHIAVLMDTDKNGRISRQEYMSFMLAEFDRLDTEKRGQLNSKQLMRSRLQVLPAGLVEK